MQTRGPAIVIILKKRICQKLKQSRKARQLQLLIKSIPRTSTSKAPAHFHTALWSMSVKALTDLTAGGTTSRVDHIRGSIWWNLGAVKGFEWNVGNFFYVGSMEYDEIVKDNFIKYYIIWLTYRRSIYCLNNYNLSWSLPLPPDASSSAKQKI